jgi:hypothetical protein
VERVIPPSRPVPLDRNGPPPTSPPGPRTRAILRTQPKPSASYKGDAPVHSPDPELTRAGLFGGHHVRKWLPAKQSAPARAVNWWKKYGKIVQAQRRRVPKGGLSNSFRCSTRMQGGGNTCEGDALLTAASDRVSFHGSWQGLTAGARRVHRQTLGRSWGDR